MKKLTFSLAIIVSALLILANMTIFAEVDSSDDAENYAPVLKLRTDLQCWPSYTNNGSNSGQCRSKDDFEADKPPVFWESKTVTVNGVDAQLITYWIYYSNQNDCCTFGGEHDDDWEKITVHLEDGILKHVTYNQHNGRYTLDAEDVPLSDDTHPVLYIGKYAHGSYHDERSKCTLDSVCYLDGNYCYYWKDPRGPGVTWEPEIVPLTDLDADITFSGSTNPWQRTRPEYDTVCRTDGGNDIAFGIGLEDTCDRNPEYLQDESITLNQMAVNSLNTISLLATDSYGGSGGSAFDDRNYVPADGIAYLKKIIIRAGSRIDRVRMNVYTGNGDYLVFYHGGTGGTYKELALNDGETLQKAEVHIGKKNGSYRVFYLKFTTSEGRTLSGGSTTSTKYTITADEGYQLIGFHGRAGSEVDKLGFIMMPE